MAFALVAVIAVGAGSSAASAHTRLPGAGRTATSGGTHHFQIKISRLSQLFITRQLPDIAKQSVSYQQVIHVLWTTPRLGTAGPSCGTARGRATGQPSGCADRSARRVVPASAGANGEVSPALRRSRAGSPACGPTARVADRGPAPRGLSCRATRQASRCRGVRASTPTERTEWRPTIPRRNSAERQPRSGGGPAGRDRQREPHDRPARAPGLNLYLMSRSSAKSAWTPPISRPRRRE